VPSTTRILIADDSDDLRRALRNVLETQPRYSVCGKAASGAETVAKARELKPDLIILDLQMPHAYRRFFATIRDAAGMNPGALKRIMGHSKGADVTARYSRAADDIAFLRSEMDRCPLGFSLPMFAAPPHSYNFRTIVLPRAEVGADSAWFSASRTKD